MLCPCITITRCAASFYYFVYTPVPINLLEVQLCLWLGHIIINIVIFTLIHDCATHAESYALAVAPCVCYLSTKT